MYCHYINKNLEISLMEIKKTKKEKKLKIKIKQNLCMAQRFTKQICLVKLPYDKCKLISKWKKYQNC